MSIIDIEAYQSLDTASWAILVYDPYLGMQGEGIQQRIDILRIASAQLLKNFDFVQCAIDGHILHMGVVVFGISIEDLQGDELTAAEIRAGKRRSLADASREKCDPREIKTSL